MVSIKRRVSSGESGVESSSGRRVSGFIKIRWVRKLAERLNDIKLVDRSVRDIFEVSDRDARILLAEGWAVIAEMPRRRADDWLPHDADDQRRQ